MIFFEVLDFPTSAKKAPASHWQLKLDSSPWYKIAWAFMLPAGRVGKTHMEEKCRLQLFQYPKRRPRKSTETTEVCTCIYVYADHNHSAVLYRFMICGPVATVLHTQVLFT